MKKVYVSALNLMKNSASNVPSIASFLLLISMNVSAEIAQRNFSRLQRSCFSALFLFVFLLSASSSWGQIAQRGSSTSATAATTNNTTITINKPSGVVAGDVLLFSVVQNETDNDNGGLTSPTLSGWTLVKDQLIRSDGTGNDQNAWFGSIYYRVSDGSEGTSFSFAMNSRCDMAIGSMVAFSGVACNALTPSGVAGGPFDIVPGNFNNANAVTATASGVTVANNSAVIMFAMCKGQRTFGSWSNSQTELFDNGTTDGDDASVGAAWLSSVNSGATGNRTVTLSSSDRNSAILLVLRRASTYSVGAASATPTLCVNTALTNITHTTSGATGIGTSTGLPSGVTAAWASNTITISGTPTAFGTFNYSIPLNGGCGTVNATGTITVTAANTAGTASSNPTLCINTELTAITRTTTGATGIGTATGLPSGVTAAWASNTITISGTPTESGTFNYSIPLTGGCGSVNATGSITVTAAPSAGTLSGTQELCSNGTTTLSSTVSGGSWTSGATGIATINASTGVVTGVAVGTATMTYTVTGTSGCANATATRIVTVYSVPSTTNATITAGGSGSLSVSSSCTDITGQTSGPRDAGSGANRTGVGTSAWSNPGNITAVGTPFATVAPALQETSNYLFATNYGFSIPANAVINGIQLTISRSSTQSIGFGNRDDQVRLVKNNNIEATNKALGAIYPTSLTSQSYGNATDLWGTTWTAADINNAQFGAVLSVFNARVFGPATATVDFMQITITYTIPGSLQWYTVSSGGTAIGSGSPFNPVGVANSGLTNTNTVGTTSYWVACSTSPGNCRSQANFIITAPANQSSNHFRSNASGTWATQSIWEYSSDSSNWYGPATQVPTSAANSIIIRNGHSIEVSNDITVVRLNLETGNINLNGKKLTIEGAISRTTGTINAQHANSTIEMAGSTEQTISGTMFNNKVLANLVNNNAVGIRLSATANDTLKVTGSVSFGNRNNSKITTNDNLTLVSTEAATAAIADITNNGVNNNNSIVGKVNVERFISLGGKWRLVAVPTNSTQTFKQSWQENASTAAANPVAGYGAIIGDNRSNWSANGFDVFTPGGATVKVFDPATSNFVGINNTNTNIKTDGGYMMYLRGNRSNTVSTTTIRTTGELYTGTQPVINVPANQFKVIGNPYAAQVNINNIISNGLQEVVYVWDPKAGGSYGLGAYQTLIKMDDDYVVFPGGGSYGPQLSVVNTIESGQAFFVKAGEQGGSIQFQESAKQVGSRLVSRSPSANSPMLRATLYTGSSLLDAAMINFEAVFNNAVDADDIVKVANGSENVSFKINNSLLVADRRQMPARKDTFRLNLTGLRVQTYKWVINADQLNTNGRVAYLLDAYNNSITPLNMNGVTEYNFTVINTASSYAANRFVIVTDAAEILPVSFTSVAATRNVSVNNEVTVNWKVESETNMNNYEVEYSVDGSNFSSIATLAPNSNNGSGVYNFLNKKATAAEHFYRIKANSIGGLVQYSAIVKVAGIKASANSNISVYPNPVANKQMNVQFNNQAAGNYGVKLINSNGSTVYQNNVTVNSNNLVRTMPLQNSTAAGTYQLIVTDASGKTQSQSIIVL